MISLINNNHNNHIFPNKSIKIIWDNSHNNNNNNNKFC